MGPLKTIQYRFYFLVMESVYLYLILQPSTWFSGIVFCKSWNMKEIFMSLQIGQKLTLHGN